MKNKLSSLLSTGALALYALLFGGITLAITFKNVIFTYRISLQFILLGALAVGLAVFLLVYKKINPMLIKHRYKLLAVFCIFMFAVQLAVSLNMVPNVMYDHDKTLNAAIVWTLEGNSERFQLYNNYLHHYPHQMGIFLLQQTIFKLAAAVGISNFFLVACVVGHLLFMVMNVTAFKYLDENISSHSAIFYLLLSAIYIPMYFQSSVSYTDTWSAWAAPCLLLFGTRAFKAESNGKTVLYSLLTGLLAGTVMQIKMTGVFVLLAMAIMLFVKGINKKQMCALALVLCAIMVTNTAFHHWNYATVLEEYRHGESMPKTHWIMMGLQGDGSYSGYDEWEITCAVPPEDRVARNIEVIKERLAEMGAGGYLKLLYTKTCRTFGSGNADLRYSFKYEEDYNPQTLLYHFVFENGSLYTINNNLSQAVYLMMNILGVAGAVIVLVKKHKIKDFSPYLALAGFWLFMMLWESSHRQLINQWSLYFITAAIGLYEIYRLIFKKD